VLPTALTLHNYRSFAGPQRMELRPVTLVYGENSAGKSSLLRSLPLLADSARSDKLDALDVHGRLAEFELDFDSLRWKGRAETDEHTVGIDLHWDDASLESARFAFWEQPDWLRVVVQQLTLHDRSGSAVGFEWIPRREDRQSAALPYRRSRAGLGVDDVSLEFRGLVPTMSAGDDPVLINALAERLRHLSTRVTWLRSLRRAPKRIIRWSSSVGRELEPFGTDAPNVLAADPKLLDEVKSWYREHLDLDLKIDDPRKREIRVVLRKLHSAAPDIDLIDTGEGLSQVLPVLTALAMADLRGATDGPSIIAVEEPEAHLHPTLAGALARRVCEVAARGNSRVVLETHSMPFLLAVQHAVLTGCIAADNVMMVWVRQLDDGRSVADPVTLTSDARLRGAWPSDAFDTELELAAEIQDLRDAKEQV
jgi:hypothetical protein